CADVHPPAKYKHKRRWVERQKCSRTLQGMPKSTIAKAAECFPRQMLSDVRRKIAPRAALVLLRSISETRQLGKHATKMPCTFCDYLDRVRAALCRSRRRLTPNERRRSDCDHRKKFSDAKPQIPVVDSGNCLVKQTDLRQDGSPEDDAAARNEIARQQKPKNISLRTAPRLSWSAFAV